MAYFKIGNTDFSSYVSGLKIGYETLVADNSGRNANGDTVLDVINHKVKVYATFRPLSTAEMATLLTAIADYVIQITFRDAKTQTTKTITCYTGTPEPEYYCIQNNKVMYKQFSLNFIEL